MVLGNNVYEREHPNIPYYLGYKAMAIYPIQGLLAFWKIELSMIYKAIALYPLLGHRAKLLRKQSSSNHNDFNTMEVDDE